MEKYQNHSRYQSSNFSKSTSTHSFLRVGKKACPNINPLPSKLNFFSKDTPSVPTSSASEGLFNSKDQFLQLGRIKNTMTIYIRAREVNFPKRQLSFECQDISACVIDKSIAKM
jgi:hypothetical protein